MENSLIVYYNGRIRVLKREIFDKLCQLVKNNGIHREDGEVTYYEIPFRPDKLIHIAADGNDNAMIVQIDKVCATFNEGETASSLSIYNSKLSPFGLAYFTESSSAERLLSLLRVIEKEYPDICK